MVVGSCAARTTTDGVMPVEWVSPMEHIARRVMSPRG
ncbi:MAG: hypothetical protein RLZZ297_499 [Chloroflexota bacterium]|jgi:hypothetical protein